MPRPDAPPHGAHVLLVEDDAPLREVVALILAEEGYRAHAAPDGAAALALLEAPDAPPVGAVLLDLRLPDMNGTEVARRLRNGKGTGGIPVVALTASAYAWSSDRLLAAGFDGYLQKPIDVRAFPEQVRGFCKL